MTHLIKVPSRSTLFESAVEAAQGIVAFDSGTETFYQYEVTARWSGGDRLLDGFEVRVKDMNGFGVGYLSANYPATGAV